MTDLEKLKALFDEFGVGYEEDESYTKGTLLICREGKPKISGYSCFFADFEFNNDGKFIQLGIGE